MKDILHILDNELFEMMEVSADILEKSDHLTENLNYFLQVKRLISCFT